MNGCLRIVLIFLGLSLLVVLIGPMVIPLPPLADTVPPRELADPDSSFVDVDGLQLHYKVKGQGEPTLVLLHGFGASVFSWRKVMAPLSESGTVIAFDRPGFGLTARPMPGEYGDQKPYSPEAQAELTVALMDELGVEKAVLAGHSAGGGLAALTALEHPERVQALVLEDAAIYGQGGTPRWLHPVLATPQMNRRGPLIVRSLVRWGEAVIRFAWEDPDRITMELVSGYKKPLQADNWDQALWELILASHPLGLEEQLGDITVPTLVVSGAHDRIVPPENSTRLARELPNAELVVISNCGHVPHEECPEEFVQPVVDFVSAQP